MTDTRLAEMSPEELANLWWKGNPPSFATFLHALIQRATRETDERWRKQVAETESATIAALREQVAGAKNEGAREALTGLSADVWAHGISSPESFDIRVMRFRDREYPAPVEAAPSVEGYSLEVNAPNAPDTITVKHNGKPVFTVALATGGGR
jgi:hypothetical protein